MKKVTLLLSTLIILCLMCFSVSAAGENAQTAVAINLSQSLNIRFNDDICEYYLKFTPQKTGFYEIDLKNFVADETYITTYDSTGKEIGFNGWDEFSNRCYDVIELSANKTYYFNISCYDYATLSATVTEHKHDFQQEFISEASEYSDGYILYDCSSCYATTKTIIPKVIISLSNENFTYNGKVQKPTVIVKDTNGYVFKAGIDYSVSYPNSINADSYELSVIMMNNLYDVSTEEYYYINEKPLTKADIKISKTTVVNGEIPNITISGLQRDKDFKYDIVYYGTGLQTVTVYGIGNYTGSADVSFTVLPSKISNLKLTAKTTSIKLSWDFNYSCDYYEVYDLSKNKIIATNSYLDTIYTVKKLKSGKKYSFKVRGYSVNNGKKTYTDWTSIEGATLPKSTSIKSVKSSKKRNLTVKLKKQSSVSGYQVQYSTSKKFSKKTTKSITLNKSSKTSKSISKLKSKKKYYVRVRTYKTVKLNGKTTKVYSSWSSAKSVKIK